MISSKMIFCFIGALIIIRRMKTKGERKREREGEGVREMGHFFVGW